MKARNDRGIVVATLAGLWCGGLLAGPAAAQSATSPYKLSVFAKNANGYTQPDSIASWQDTIFVGFQNGVAKDGSDGKSSTIVQYSRSGAVERTFPVKGHNDGLRVIGDNLWALQNEDANPNLVIIDLSNGSQTTFFPPAPHGGGYDDLRVLDGQIYMSASNPTLDAKGVNDFPALVRVQGLSGSTVILEPVLQGNASAIDIPTGGSVTLNLTDPDSLSIDLRGNLVLDSQADGEVVFIRHPHTDHPTVGRINITTPSGPTTVDDTAFTPAGQFFLLFSDVQAGVVYRLDAPDFGFEPGTAYSTSDTAGIVGILDLDNGVLNPIATGFGSTRGAEFVPVKDEDPSATQ
jgi:hypothetical protein